MDRQWEAKAVAVTTDETDGTTPSGEEVILQVNGVNHFGDPVFCYVKLPVSSYDTIRARIEAHEDFSPREYGTVIAAGLGEPTHEMKQEIAQDFGVVPVPIQAGSAAE